MRRPSSITLSLLFISLQIISNTIADRLLDKMYTTINSSICFRRLNGTHSTGCGSTLGGSVGVLHFINSNHDFEFIIDSPPAPPYTLIVPPRLFTRDNILNVTKKAKGNIAGIVIIENRTETHSFSHESRCPNQYGGLLKDQTCDRNDASKSWNPYGTGLLHEDFPFPIIYVKDQDSINNLTDCYQRFNSFDMANQQKRSLCGIQIKSFMSAAVNSEVCIRRTSYQNSAVNPPRYCDPLQSKNIYATLKPRDRVKTGNRSVISNEEIILISARIDTTSMFDGIGLGAMDSMIPAVTLMSIAHTLSKIYADPSEHIHQNVLFMLFNGESYDYIGSQRFVYDMNNGDFPLRSSQTQPIHLENIKFHIDIGSLDSLNSITIYQYENFTEADNFAQLFKQNSNNNHGVNIAVNRNTTHNIPPTSAQTFLRDNQTFPAVIFYSDTNKNRFYHSIYDDVNNIGFQYKNTSKNFMDLVDFTQLPPNFAADSIQIAIRNFASIFSFAMYEMLSGHPYTKANAANPYLIDELLYCYLESAKCPLFRAAVKDPKSLHVQDMPPYRYISVQNAMSYETVGWTYRILGLLTGQPQSNYNEKNCTQLPLAWFSGYNGIGQCLLTTQNLSDAYSPAFSIENYDWKSGRYSTWTESTWSEINVRIFVKPPSSHEAFTLTVGFVTLLLSFVIVFFINSKSEILFGESTSSINVLTLPTQC